MFACEGLALWCIIEGGNSGDVIGGVGGAWTEVLYHGSDIGIWRGGGDGLFTHMRIVHVKIFPYVHSVVQQKPSI